MRNDEEVRQMAREALQSHFPPDRIETAMAILLCLFSGEQLPKEGFAGVSVQEVRAVAEKLGMSFS